MPRSWLSLFREMWKFIVLFIVLARKILEVFSHLHMYHLCTSQRFVVRAPVQSYEDWFFLHITYLKVNRNGIHYLIKNIVKIIPCQNICLSLSWIDFSLLFDKMMIFQGFWRFYINFRATIFEYIQRDLDYFFVLSFD